MGPWSVIGVSTLPIYHPESLICTLNKVEVPILNHVQSPTCRFPYFFDLKLEVELGMIFFFIFKVGANMVMIHVQKQWAKK